MPALLAPPVIAVPIELATRREFLTLLAAATLSDVLPGRHGRRRMMCLYQSTGLLSLSDDGVRRATMAGSSTVAARHSSSGWIGW